MGAGFWKLWTAALVSRLGDGVRLTAFPLLAAALTRDPKLVAGLTFVQGLPWLVFGLVAGALVDRIDRRLTMAIVNAGRALAAAGLAVAIAVGWGGIVLLYVVAFLLGTGETLVDNASQAFLPRLVSRQELRRANGRLQVAGRIGNEFAGPPLGGLLFGVAHAAPVVLDAATFGGASAAVLAVRGRFRVDPDPDLAPTTLFAEVREGLAWLRGQRELTAIAASVAVFALVDSAWFSVFVLYALEVLRVGSLGYGLLILGGGVGAIAASIVAPRLPTRAGLVGSLVLAAATQLALGLTAEVAVAAAMLALSGACFGVWGVIASSLRQELVPDRLLGRTSSVYLFLGLGATAVGALVGGAVADAAGIRAPFLLGVPLLAATAVYLGRALERA